MIDKAGRLFAQVNMDEAKRALEAARKEETVVQSALKVLLNKKDADANIIPTSPLFMNDSLPPKMLFDLSVNSGNYSANCPKWILAEYSPFWKTDLVFAWYSE